MIRIGPGRRPSRGASFLMAVILAVTFLVTVPSSLRAQDYLEVGEINTGEYPDRRESLPLSFQTMVHAGAGYGFPAGDWYNELDEDLAFDLGVRLAAGDRTYVHILYIHQNLVSPAFTFYGEDELIYQATTDAKVSEFFFLVGTQIDRRSEQGISGYIEGGPGVQKITGTVRFGGLETSTSESNLALGVRVGLIIPLGRALAADLGADARVKPDFVLEEEEPGGVLWGVRAGLAYQFPRD
ncbi:MAG: hypothetical protein AB7V45_03075 [Candidatus Krumholzibacteriia bacterium]